MKTTIVPVCSFGTVVTGKTPKTSNENYYFGNIPFITPTDIPDFSTKHLFKTESYISQDGLNSQKNTLLPKNSICVSCIATIGKVVQTIEPSITNQQINSIICNENFDSDYLFYLFRYYLEYLVQIGGGTGSGTPIISKEKFKKLKYPVFLDIQYQQKVASVLSTYDKLIENNNKRIAILEQEAEEIYKEWFVRFRFPRYKAIEFKNIQIRGWIYGSSSILKIPFNWEFGSFSMIGSFVRGKNITADKMNSGDIPVISAGLEPSGYHNNSNVKGPSITISASGANAGYMSLHFSDIWAADCSYYQDKKWLWFAYSALKFLQPVITNMQIGAAQPHVYPKNIDRLFIVIPDNKTLNDFNILVDPIFNDIKNLYQQNKFLGNQRDLLLPRLMSGKLEVK